MVQIISEDSSLEPHHLEAQAERSPIYAALRKLWGLSGVLGSVRYGPQDSVMESRVSPMSLVLLSM